MAPLRPFPPQPPLDEQLSDDEDDVIPECEWRPPPTADAEAAAAAAWRTPKEFVEATLIARRRSWPLLGAKPFDCDDGVGVGESDIRCVERRWWFVWRCSSCCWR